MTSYKLLFKLIAYTTNKSAILVANKLVIPTIPTTAITNNMLIINNILSNIYNNLDNNLPLPLLALLLI